MGDEHVSRMIDILRAAGNVGALWDRRTGSLLDTSGNANNVAAIVSTWQWERTRKGVMLGQTNAASSMTFGTSATMDLTTAGTLVCAWQQDRGLLGTAYMFHKGASWATLLNGWYFYLAANPTVVLGEAAATQVVASTRSSDALMSRPAFGVFTWGTNCQWSINGVPEAPIARTRTPSPVGQTLRFGGNGDLSAGILLAYVINRECTPAECSKLYTDWMSETVNPQQSSRILYSYPAKTAVEYTAEGIVLDTDGKAEMVAGTRRIRDLTGNYPGTIIGVVTPGAENQGARFLNLTSDVNHGDVTAMNLASKLTIEMVLDIPPGLIYDTWFLRKYNGGTEQIAIGPASGGGLAAKNVFIFFAHGAGTYGFATTGYVRAGTQAHVLVSFDGTGATDPDKLQLQLDGDNVALSVTNPPIAATTPNLATTNLRSSSGVETMIGTVKMRRIYNTTLSAAARRKAYLHWAQQIALQIPGEHIHVSLGATATSGDIAPWRIISGTWKVSEDATGKRWMECVTDGCVVAPQSKAFGTFTWTSMKVKSATDHIILFNGSVPQAWNNAGQNGYMYYLSGGARMFAVSRVTAGGDATRFASNVFAGDLNTEYQWLIHRRPSDGRFTMYIKGGAYAVWTLVVPGGVYTNPTSAETTYTTSSWISLTFGAGDKLLIHDPHNNSCPNRILKGPVDPTAGELL